MGKTKAHDFGIIKGNPFEITFRQHFLPNGLMRHFSTKENKIYRVVKPFAHVELIKYERNDDYAISLRAWNTRMEEIFTAIETKFYAVRESVASGVDHLSKDDCIAISNFLASWKVRPNYLRSSREVHKIYGIPEPQFPPEIISEWIAKTDQREADIPQYIREHLEKKGGRLSVPTLEDHEVNSHKVWCDYECVSLGLKNIRWMVHRLSDLEIALPDEPPFHFVPINPSTVLLPEKFPVDMTSADGISMLNYAIVTESRSAYWCHDINRLIKLPA
ncbi:hypothetical protein L5M28_15680 [Shewanella sp. SW32]|uniref:hypothetical protein n=1 Tax=unclassified Shewanella TaxID=196818 RepID=UPI0021D9BB22|nr:MULTISPECIES: hypothetical protein [unclassified Shewanella]MCU7963999.1 hypothetical protein [Shewanella sp. SW32]MCU7971816.1 hypothetical protein [Shewanella sp. SW29]